MSTWIVITVAELLAGLVGFAIGTLYPDALTRKGGDESARPTGRAEPEVHGLCPGETRGRAKRQTRGEREDQESDHHEHTSGH